MHSPSQLASLEAIRDAARRYCRGVDRLDADVMRSAYWPDATDDHGTFVGNAWAFVNHCMTSHARWRSTMHCILNHSIEFDDDSHARGEIYNVTYLFHATQPEQMTWYGRYLDRYECRDGAWRISERVCVREAVRHDPIDQDPGRFEAFRSGDVDRAVPGRPLGP